MALFKFSTEIGETNLFLIDKSKLEGRLDPIFYASDLTKFNSGKFKSLSIAKIAYSFKSGFGAGKKDQTDAESGIIHIRPTNLGKDGLLKFDKNVFVPKNDKADLLEKGDVLFNNTNSQELVGKTSIVTDNKELYYSNHITRIKVNKNLILPEYLWIILNLYQEHKIFYSICTNWNNQSGVGLELLKQLKIPVPDILDQKNIIRKYIDGLKEKKKKQKEAKKALSSIDDYLIEELGIKLPEIDNSLKNRIFKISFNKINGKRFDPNHISKINFLLNQNWNYPKSNLRDLLLYSPQYGANESACEGNEEIDTRYIRITDIDEIGNLKKKGWKTAENIEPRYLLNKNDVLFARSGSVGKCYIHKEDSKPAIFAGYLIRFVLNPKLIIPDYLFYFCNSSIYKFWVSAIERPAVQSNINSEEFKSLKIPLPNIDTQLKIVNRVKSIRDSAKKMNAEAEFIMKKIKEEIELTLS